MKVKLLFTAVVCLVASCAAAQASPQRRFHKQPVQKDAPAPQQVVPAAPLSPEQMPASPPQVAFSTGILTIIANNSTLGDILRAVHRQTGASVDVPGNATERVVGKFGPGPVRDVLTLLLNGSHFNYVLLGSATNPNALDRVMLISRSGGTEESAQQASSAAAQYQAPAVAVPQSAENQDVSSDDAADMTPDSPDTAEDQANQGPPEEPPQQQPNPFGQPGAVKTPEQLLQELQQRQQQMEQQQQQQPGAPRAFPPTPMGAPQPQQAPPQ